MSRTSKSRPGAELPEGLRELLEGTRPASEAMAELEAEPLHLSQDPDFVADRLKGDIVEGVLRAMDETGINKSQLAERLGKSRQWVTRVLNEGDNFTVATVAKLACALGRDVTIKLERNAAIVQLSGAATASGHGIPEAKSE